MKRLKDIINEISSKTLGNYVKAASHDSRHLFKKAWEPTDGNQEANKKLMKKFYKRVNGIEKATDKLVARSTDHNTENKKGHDYTQTKPNHHNEEVETIDEVLKESKELKQISSAFYQKAYDTIAGKKKWQNKDFDNNFDNEVDDEFKKHVDNHIKNNPTHKSFFYKNHNTENKKGHNYTQTKPTHHNEEVEETLDETIQQDNKRNLLGKFNPEKHELIYKDNIHKVISKNKFDEYTSKGWKRRNSVKAFFKEETIDEAPYVHVNATDSKGKVLADKTVYVKPGQKNIKSYMSRETNRLTKKFGGSDLKTTKISVKD